MGGAPVIRVRYRGQHGSAWRSMVDADVWMFQADTSEKAQPVLEGELRIVQVEENREGDLVASNRDLVVSAVASLVLFGLVWVIVDHGWAVALRVACGLALIAAALWTAWRAR